MSLNFTDTNLYLIRASLVVASNEYDRCALACEEYPRVAAHFLQQAKEVRAIIDQINEVIA